MRITGLGRTRRWRRASALAAGAAFALQALAVSRLLCTPSVLESAWSAHVLCAPRAWPFLDYPMFKDAHRVGTVIERWTVAARTIDAREFVLRPEVPAERARADGAITAMRAGDGARARRAFDGLCGVVAIELRREELVLELDGLRSRSCEVVASSSCDAEDAP